MNMFKSDPEVKNKYTSSENNVTRNGGNVIDYGYIEDFRYFNLGTRSHQSRNMGEDKTHLSNLEGSIANEGLKNLPTVEYNAVTKTYDALSGHHRISAINNLRNQTKENDFSVGFPVVVAKFSDPISREFFIQDENNHQPAKPHCKKDAVDFLIRLWNNGHFSNFSETEVETEAKQLVKKYNQTLYTKSISDVYKKFKIALGVNSKIRFLLPSDVQQEAQSIWNIKRTTKFRSGQAHPAKQNTCIVCSVPTAADKAIFNIGKDNCQKKDANPNYPTTEIELALYWDRVEDVSKLKKQRDKCLKEYGSMNKRHQNLWKITTIYFINQIQLPSPEVRQTFIWDEQLQRFL